MGDGSFDVGRLLRAVKERSKAQILFDMDQAAEESGGVINAVLLGALAGSGKLPIPDGAFEAAIREGGKAVDTNLAAFAFGRGHARGELEQAVREHRKRQAAAQGVEDLIERARTSFPAASLDVVEEGIRRLAAYQDRRYAALYLDRLAGIDAAPIVREGGAASRGAHVVRGRDPRGAGQDLARAAGAGARRGAAKPHEPLEITEHFKPGNEEIAAMLPPSLARLCSLGRRTGGWASSISPCMCAARRSGASPGCACWPACAGGGRTPGATPRSRPRSSAGWRRSAPRSRSASTWRARSPNRRG